MSDPIDLNELEKGQENWLAVVARQKAEARREAHKNKLIEESKRRHQERREKVKTKKKLP